MATQFALRIGGRYYLMTAKEAAPVMDALASARCVDDAWVYLNADGEYDPDAEGVRIWRETQAEEIALAPFAYEGVLWPQAQYDAYREAESTAYKARREAEKAAKEAAEG